MSSDFTVGVVIANHNYACWVANAIESAVKESYKHKLIAVVDDGSTDNSWDVICSKLNIFDKQEEVCVGELSGIPTFAYRFPTAGGPARARNKGIEMLWTSVDGYQFLDADDEIREGKITCGVEKVSANAKIGAVYSDYDTFNINTGVYFREYKEPFSRERLTQECIVNNNSLVTKEALATVGVYDESLRVCEDYDLWLRVSERFMICHIPEALQFLRIHTSNSTSQVKKDIWQECWTKVMLKTKERARQ